MKKLTKTIALCSAMAVAAGMFVGCGEKKAADINLDANNMNNKLEISWMGLPYNPSAQEGTYPETLLEKTFNVELKPIFLDKSNYNDKKTMMLASGEKVDMIYELDPSNVKQDADQGLIMEIPYETIKKYAPTAYSIVTEHAPEAWLYSRVGDKNYGLPNLNYSNEYSRCGMWRTDWLKKVGIDKIPSTLEEMHDALYKFTYNDPDGDGKKDTYGMSGDIKNWNTTFTDIFGAYGVIPFDWMKNGDTAVYGGFQSGTKEALQVLQKWYSEGIIDPDFITDDVWTTGRDKFKNGVVGFINQNGGYMDESNPNSFPNLMKQINPSATIENALQVTGPEGKSGTFAWGAPCHIVSFGAQLADDQEKLVRLLTMFEKMVTDEDFVQKLKLGEQGKQWDYMDASAGFAKGIKFLPPYDDESQQKNECLSADFQSPTFFEPVTLKNETALKFTVKAKTEVMEKYCSVEKAMNDAFMKPDTLPSSAEHFADIRTKQLNLMVQVIKGEKTPEQYESEFKTIWSNGGGDKLEKEAKDMSSTINTIYKEVGATVKK